MTVSKRIRKYKLSLSYERPFDPTEGKQTKLKIFFELTDSAGNIRMVSEDQSMRMFQGDSVEELLYTVDEFIKLRETMTGFEDDMLHDEFKKVLEHDHRETFIQLMADNNYARDRDGFDQAINHLIEDIGRDPHGKESMIAAIMQGELRKPKLVDVIDHHKRYMWLIKCVDRLSTSNAFFLTEEEIKNYYEYTYPHEWVLEYQMARPETETIVQMRDYMVLKQQKVNLKEKGNENSQGKRKSNDSRDTRDRKKGGRGGGRQGRGGRGGGRGEGKGSNKTDWQGTKYEASGPKSRCTLHENSNHTWGDCSKYPNSANSRPDTGGGRGRGNGGRGGGGRGGGGGRYNNDRGNYYQGNRHQPEPRRDEYNNNRMEQRDNYSIEEARRIVSEIGPGPRLPPYPNNNNNDGYYNYQNQRY